ncbi:MAG: aldolase/citrate lyase family protein [bacterium]
MKGCTGLLKRRVKKGDMLLVGCIMDSRSGTAIEMYHECGYDVVMIDREHTALNSETILEQLRMCRALGIPSMVRVADHSYHEFNRFLDQAADGIMVPRIRSRADVERVIQTVRYPPLGQRGLGGSTCPVGRYMGWPKLVDQIAHVNKELVVGIQIETIEALADVDNILSVPGVDMAIVGNDDLSIGMGIPGQLNHPRYIKAVETIIAACRRHGVLPGIAGGDPTWVRYWRDKGMRVFWCAADVISMWDATRKGMAAIKVGLAAKTAPKSPFPASAGKKAVRVRYSK